MRPHRTILILLGWGVVFSLLIGGSVHAQPAPMAQDDTHTMDIAEADAFIWAVFSELEALRYDLAAQVYLWMLEQLDQPLASAEQAILLKHLRPLTLILPEQNHAATGLSASIAAGTLDTLPPGTGRRLVQWWRRQDPLPGTEENERLTEHLERVVTAAHMYPDDQDERGVDDRGEVFIRLGPPSRKSTIEIRNASLQIDPFVPVLPENEFWVYRHVSDVAQYLFIRKSKKSPFALGYATDLVPASLYNGRRKTPQLLQVMEEIYAQLALQHAAFGTRYDDLAHYLGLPNPSATQPAHLFALSALSRGRVEDQQFEWQRQETVPPSYSGARRNTQPLAVPVRWARFLDADGTTRTEFYWGLGVNALKPSRGLVRRLKKQGDEPSENYLLSMAVAQRSADHQARRITRKHYLIPTDTKSRLPAKTFVVQGDSGLYNLALQWEQQWTRTSPEQPDARLPGATLKIGTLSVDSLKALHHEGRRLEMSDLKPLLAAPGDALEAATPFSGTRLAPDTPLALYFELYHLTFAADDQTHYTIEYTITGKQGRGMLGLRKPRDGESVGARSSYTSTSRTAQRYVMLDLSTWQEQGEIDITLRATDETTGQEIARTLSFVIQP